MMKPCSVCFLFFLSVAMLSAEDGGVLFHVEGLDDVPRDIVQEQIRAGILSLPPDARPRNYSIGTEKPESGTAKKMLSLCPVRPGGEENLYAASGFLFAVSEKSELKELSPAQARSLFDGVLTAWEEKDEQGKTVRTLPVIVCIPEGDDGRSLIPAPAGEKDRTSTQIRIRFPDGETLIRHTEENPDAVALLPLSFPILHPNGLRILPVAGIEPNRENILNGRYPFSTLYALTCPERSPSALAAEKNLKSRSTAKTLLRAGLIPLWLKPAAPR